MNYILFEDHFTQFLKPFSDFHASFEIRCGQFKNIDRLISFLDPTDTLTLIVRKEIEELISEKFNNLNVNPENIEPGLWLNGSTIWSEKTLNKVNDKKTYANEDILYAFTINKRIKFNDYEEIILKKQKITSQIEFPHISFLWDAIKESHHQIQEDFLKKFPTRYGKINPSAIIINEESIHIGTNANIKAGVIIDATNGPIIIEDNVKIDIGALLQGPLFIGQDSIINPGSKLRGNVIIGPCCKIGGEIEDSVLQGYSNKQHDGFLGHSYISEWVNIGANTNTSDLKNTYGKIKFKFPELEVNTGEIFIGAMIGDFVRTGISTMLNTGSYIGIGANVFGGEFQDKYIPSFKWGRTETVKWQPFIETCKRMKKRRNKDLSLAETNRLRTIYKTF
tara:strand:- start:1639 stop:2817 length:1179 start_codon:yes stop_codon:yes gene_type:complete